jgi:hypothetical protein
MEQEEVGKEDAPVTEEKPEEKIEEKAQEEPSGEASDKEEASG